MMTFKRTKIVCTIGPASSSKETLTELIKAGMNVARLNFSHGTHEEHAELIRRIRTVAVALNEPVALLQDLQGPKIRVGVLPKEGVQLKAGDHVIFTTGQAAPGDLRLPVTYERLHEDVKIGERILLDDGLLSAKAIEIRGRDVVCEVIDGGVLTSHKGVNFPDSALRISPITEKDKADLIFGVQQGVDFIALSFVRSALEIRDLRVLIEAATPAPDVTPIRVIAKIEKHEAVEQLDEIIEAADAIMVARGDLGIETDAASVPIVQKRIIATCLKAAKPVIVATQMLDSMIRNPRPTRAEVSDVANAVIDHADAVMLSAETASGAHPVEAVLMMAKIALETEASPFDDLETGRRFVERAELGEAASEVAKALVSHSDVKLVLVASARGELGRLVSRLRPEMPILVVTDDGRVQRQMNLCWGVMPLLRPRAKDADAFFAGVAGALQERGLAVSGEKVIVIAGDPLGTLAGRLELREVP